MGCDEWVDEGSDKEGKDCTGSGLTQSTVIQVEEPLPRAACSVWRKGCQTSSERSR